MLTLDQKPIESRFLENDITIICSISNEKITPSEYISLKMANQLPIVQSGASQCQEITCKD